MQTLVVLLALLSVAQSETVGQFVNDNLVLNYALTLENFEAALYAAGLAQFGTTDANYTAAGYPKGTAAVIALIAGQEATHASALNSTLFARGFPAVQPCKYNFTFTSVSQYVNLLYTVENVGTKAYDGASNALTSATLLSIAAGIATVEARHTAVLAVITNGSYAAPFPEVFESTFNASQAFAAASAFFVPGSCPSSTLNTTYAGVYTVNSGDPSTYATFQDAATVRGNTTVISADGKGNYNVGNAIGQAAAANDLAVINYALTLENLEADFYATFNSSYTVDAINAAYANNTNVSAALLSASIALIASHEATHVSQLTATITGFGAPAVAKCSYNYTNLGVTPGVANFTAFLAAARTLEQTGVRAYVGAIGLIINPFTARTAATIATVEARHSSYLNDVALSFGAIYGVNGTANFFAPDLGAVVNDQGLSPTTVVGTLNSLKIFNSCPASNPPFYGQNYTNDALDFFGDNSSPFNQPLPASSTSGNTNSTSTNNGGTGNPTSSNGGSGTTATTAVGTGGTTPGTNTGNASGSTTGGSSTFSVCLALLAFAMAVASF